MKIERLFEAKSNFLSVYKTDLADDVDFLGAAGWKNAAPFLYNENPAIVAGFSGG